MTSQPASTRSNRRNSTRRGAVIVFVAAMIVVLAGMAAFSVDVGFLATTNARMRAAADAAALAGAGAMTDLWDQNQVSAVALDYALNNVPPSYGTVASNSSITFGIWDPELQVFTPNGSTPEGTTPNAIRVVLERNQSRGNPVPMFFGRIFGQSYKEMTVEAVAVGAVSNIMASATNHSSVYVTSTKDLSNVVLLFEDGTHQKFDGLSKYSGTFKGTGEHAGKTIVGVWIKSGCNHSSDGPGYGEYLPDPLDGTTIHGKPASGCSPHVTATFESTGVEFSQSGAYSPVRLVK